LETSLLTQLNSATWHRHEQMEQLPFVRALTDCTLPLQSYIAQLRGMAIIFSSIENSLSSLPEEMAGRLRPLTSQRFKMLCNDLFFFSPRMIPDIQPAIKFALDTAKQIHQAAPEKLLGYQYVLQGTTRGNQVHLADIISCFKFDEEGTSFYRGYGANTDSVWEDFCSIVNASNPDNTSQAILGATEMYGSMERFHQLLYPLPEDGDAFTAAGLNPEAGEHPVPQESSILQAAIRAGIRCREEFSYYERRYGERGRRFTNSDVSWLAALSYLDEHIILEQVLWLGRVLSARGMPTMLLERQLELLHEELAALDFHPPLDNLLGALQKLKQQREQVADQERCDKVHRSLSTMLHGVEFPDLPVILIAAQLDMLCGLPECRASLLAWVTEQRMLTPIQVEAVVAILADL